MDERLSAPLSVIKGAGQRRIALLEKLGLRTIYDLLFFFPRKYEDRRNVRKISALVPGAPIAFLLPTVEQVSQLITALEIGPFEETEVCEVLVRPWKVVPGRLRPADRMSAHTAFLVFTRIQERSADWDALIPLGTRERKQEAARQARLAAARGEDPESVDYEI